MNNFIATFLLEQAHRSRRDDIYRAIMETAFWFVLASAASSATMQFIPKYQKYIGQGLMIMWACFAIQATFYLILAFRRRKNKKALDNLVERMKKDRTWEVK